MSETQHTDAEGEQDPPPDEGHPAPSKPVRNARPRRRRKKAAEPVETAAPRSEKRPEPTELPRPPEAPAEEETQLLPVGNPLRLLRGGAAIVLGSLLAFCLMALASQYRFGVPV